MTFGPVGIRCPDHATVTGKQAAPRRAARTASRSLSQYGSFVTFTLIGINVGVYLLQLVMGAGLSASSGWIYEHGVLVSTAIDSSGQAVGVAEGEWWRLITATFLHYGPLHLGMNMLVLWFIGPPLEDYFGHWRYLLVYVVSGLAGSAGALLWSPDSLDRRGIGGDLGDHGCRARPRSPADLGLRRAGDGPRRLQPRDHVPHPWDLDRRPHRRAGRRRSLRARVLELQRIPALATLSLVGVGVLSVAVALMQVA